MNDSVHRSRQSVLAVHKISLHKNLTTKNRRDLAKKIALEHLARYNQRFQVNEHKNPPIFRRTDLYGGPERIRTADLRNANAALYQLSHRPSNISREILNLSTMFTTCVQQWCRTA